MNKTTAAARIAARTIHPLDSHVPAERAARIAQDHILSVPALREITPADILAAHKAAARAVALDSPIPSPAECDAQMSELHAGDDTAAAAACAHVHTCRYFEPVTITPAQDHTPATIDAAAVRMAAALESLIDSVLVEYNLSAATNRNWAAAVVALDAYRAAAQLPAIVR